MYCDPVAQEETDVPSHEYGQSVLQLASTLQYTEILDVLKHPWCGCGTRWAMKCR